MIALPGAKSPPPKRRVPPALQNVCEQGCRWLSDIPGSQHMQTQEHLHRAQCCLWNTVKSWLNLPLQRVTSPEPAKIKPSVFGEGVWCWCPDIYRTNPMSFHLAQVFLAGAISKSRLGSAQTAHQHCRSCHSILYNLYIPLVYYHSLSFVFHYPYLTPV